MCKHEELSNSQEVQIFPGVRWSSPLWSMCILQNETSAVFLLAYLAVLFTMFKLNHLPGHLTFHP